MPQTIENVLVLSEQNDLSTQKVLDYLDWKGIEVVCLLQENVIRDFSLNLSDDDLSLQIEDKELSPNTFWYRRGDFKKHIPFKSSDKNALPIGDYLTREWEVVKSFLHWHFEDAPLSLGSFDKEVRNNKIWDLKTAQKVGLNIPNTLVTTSKDELQAFKSHHGKIITKPLKSSFNISTEDGIFHGEGTQLVSDEHIEALAVHFFPLLVQVYIEKEIEIRVFYLDEQVYAMAIFSQLDNQTKIDYRYYNRERPNRNVPFKLPLIIKKQVIHFMKSSGLKTGSIDLIMTPDEKFVFLEVNPVGQFDWLSANCNYYLEEKIADYLIQTQL